MFFTKGFSRAEVEGPSLNIKRDEVTRMRNFFQGQIVARVESGRHAFSNKASLRFLHLLDRQPGPSTAARVSLMRKENFRLAFAQDDGIVCATAAQDDGHKEAKLRRKARSQVQLGNEGIGTRN